MKFGHRVHGKIEGYDERGRGIFQLTGRKIEGYQEGSGTVAIPFTAKDDEVTAVFLKRDRGVKVAKLETLDVAGPDRVKAPCPHAGVCGGCLWQHLDYKTQTHLKRGMINSAFEKAEHPERIIDVIPSVEQFHHRNRMDYAIGWNGEIGLKEYDSWNRYVDLKTCLLLNDGVGEILQQVREWMRESDLQPWDAKFHHGDVRYVVIREGKNTKQRMVIIVVKDALRITEDMRQALTIRLTGLKVEGSGLPLTTLLLGEQNSITDLSYAQTFWPLKGEVWLEEEVNGLRYRIHPNSFFQTNTAMASVLQDKVLEKIDPDAKHILDLYCGLGFFGIAMAKKFSEVKIHGHELDAEAIKLAAFNAETNGVSDRCTFTAGPSEDLSWANLPADLIVVDPPRSGLHPNVIKTLLEKKSKTIVYISCNYKRLVEELKLLKVAYDVEAPEALDLFPHSPHVEVVTKLTLKKT